VAVGEEEFNHEGEEGKTSFALCAPLWLILCGEQGADFSIINNLFML